MRIILTGATGLLGRNLLFEILKQNLNRLEDLEIFVLGRPQKEAPLEERLDNIIANDGYDYIGIGPKSSVEVRKKIDKSINPIAFDLTHDDLGISPDDFEKLKEKKIDHFFHVAALTDFRAGSAIEDKLEEVNVKGTQRVLSLISKLKVDQLIYISSAYACGSKTGVVEPDYVNINEQFRNPYEKSKLKAEILVRDFAKKNKLNFKVFRPSTICGRLIEKPIGCINKFDVFYAWGSFFLRIKYKHLQSLDNIYDIKYQLPIRIHFNPNSGLNIIPVDFAAKVLYQTSTNNWPGNSYYLANVGETPHKLYVKMILDALGMEGYSFVANEPTDKNEIEKFYYKTVGKIFTPYAVSKPIMFDVSNLKYNLRKINLVCPEVNEKALTKLVDFAKKKFFGLNFSDEV
jgi:nucleoside-diphosphate-sugar epimerase